MTGVGQFDPLWPLHLLSLLRQLGPSFPFKRHRTRMIDTCAITQASLERWAPSPLLGPGERWAGSSRKEEGLQGGVSCKRRRESQLRV